MAEALVSLLIEHFGSMALEPIEEEVRLVKGVDEDVANLKTNLEDIQAVLEDAEQKQLNDASLKRWLDKLKNATHDMDDVLDEWNTAILEFKIKKEEEAENNASSSNKKVCFPMPSSCFCFTRVKRLTLRRDIALKIKELNQDLDRIAKDKEKYNLNIKRVVERPERRQTTFLIDETKVQGRDKDKSLLICKLLRESSDDGSRLDITPIVGMGGLGKTTLAQLAYNDETIKTHFDKRIWVCVSDPFEEVKIAKAIIEGLGNSAPSSVELNALVHCIHESVAGKRFLLILDDLWLEDYSRWETFYVALKNGAIGSKILVTTRKQEVSIMMGAATHQISLERLSEEHCWLIFSQLAFMEGTTEKRA
ncbi:Disease resistance protein RGA2 [Morus notabilis]|uniref:Disease resistance protein RGA2 n=1 Tax=Morus notabilis TaxID=981085 RepID=W9R419_9ROSA|nr:disease resistance protein RGA2 [Morus notabilis]EXB67283.1 Disease resistance protein RGA2 [Morus notabilis]